MSRVTRQMFEECVISIPWSIKATKNTSKKPNAKSTKNSEIMTQVLKFVYDGFIKVCKIGQAGQAEKLGLDYATITLINSYFLKETNAVGNLFNDLIYMLEYPKGIYYTRQVKGTKTREQNELVSSSSFVEEICKELPPDWVVCTFSLDIERDILYVSRMQSNLRNSLFKLPLKRFATREGEVNGPGFSYKVAQTTFSDIMDGNKETTSNAKFCTTPKQRRDWFSARSDLDSRLEQFLQELEQNWLGAFKVTIIHKGVLSPIVFSDNHILKVEQFKERILNLLHRNVFTSKKSKSAKMIDIDISVFETFLRIDGVPSYEDAEDMLYFLLDFCQGHGLTVQLDEIDIEQMREEALDAFALFRRDTNDLKKVQGHLVIIPDRHSIMFPWESIPILRKCSTSRMPSLESLKRALGYKRSISAKNSFVVLNPGGDLTKTQSKFENLFPKYLCTNPDHGIRFVEKFHQRR